jgi:hypothetical protein
LIGIDLSTQREVVNRSKLEHQTAQASAKTAAAVEGGAPGTSGSADTNARAASGGAEGHGAS